VTRVAVQLVERRPTLEGSRHVEESHGAAAVRLADEIATMVTYLVGPEAGFVTGASLTIDGGFTA
jgi:3-oxoacyl-[acyl-carrier protein] reductase